MREQGAEHQEPTSELLPSAEPAEPTQPEVVTEAAEGRSKLSDVASSLAEAAAPVVSAARAPIDTLASEARRFISARSGARVRRVRRMARLPLANLWEEHPEARRASIRELGLHTIPVAQIAGTAVEGAAQRGGDFLPLRDRRSDDWRARWQRILSAIDQLQSLPPIEVVKFGDKFWVVDGHNRVAAALYNGQDEIDAEVDELRLPGVRSEPATFMAPVLEGSLDLRAAGSGRLTRTANRPEVIRPQVDSAPRDVPTDAAERPDADEE